MDQNPDYLFNFFLFYLFMKSRLFKCFFSVYVGDGGGWQEEPWGVQGGYSDDQFYPVAPSGNPFGIPEVIYKGLTFILVFLALKESWSLVTNIIGLKKTFWDGVTARSLDPETTEQIMNMIDQGALKFADWVKQE